MDATTRRLPSRPRARARIVAPLFHRILDRIDAGLEAGAIEASLPDGTARLLGGRAEGPVAVVRVHRWRALWRLVSAGSIGWYEAWEEGDWSSPDEVPIFDLFMRNRRTLGDTARAKRLPRVLERIRHATRRNDRRGSRRNIAEHYDLGNDFYREWLDPTLTYSSALFDDDALEAAQRRKLAAMLARTDAEAGDHVLEIGCGWGSFAETAAAAGVAVTCLTLSEEQRSVVAGRKLPGVDVTLTDYRDVTGTYDAVVSIEMVEAVGAEYWRDYLQTIARVLRPGGRAAIQYIAIADDVWESYASNVDFIQRYVFPGGTLIREGAFLALAREAGLEPRDRHAFGLDYAETLRRWRLSFERAATEGRLPERFDARFRRLWRFYLMYCEGGFRGGGIDVVQLTLTRQGAA